MLSGCLCIALLMRSDGRPTRFAWGGEGGRREGGWRRRGGRGRGVREKVRRARGEGEREGREEAEKEMRVRGEGGRKEVETSGGRKYSTSSTCIDNVAAYMN